MKLQNKESKDGSSSKSSGVHHWWHQRITSIIMFPLTIWLIYFVHLIYGMNFADVLAVVRLPHNVIMINLFLIVFFYHSALGVQVVIEDYISNFTVRYCLIVSLYVFVTVTVISSIIALLFLMII